MPSKSAANATAIPIEIDVEHGNHDAITPSASSSFTPNEPRSKAATPTLRRSLEVEDVAPRHHTFQTPRIWTKLEARLPAPVVRSSHKVVGWIKGPVPPRPYHIAPVFERLQTLPVRLLARLPRWIRSCIYAAAFVLWAVLFGVVLTNYSMPTNLAGFGAPVALSCVTNLWQVSSMRFHATGLTIFSGPTPSPVASTVATVSPSIIRPLRLTALPIV
jgi:hypothetical protein